MLMSKKIASIGEHCRRPRLLTKKNMKKFIHSSPFKQLCVIMNLQVDSEVLLYTYLSFVLFLSVK